VTCPEGKGQQENLWRFIRGIYYGGGKDQKRSEWEKGDDETRVKKELKSSQSITGRLKDTLFSKLLERLWGGAREGYRDKG